MKVLYFAWLRSKTGVSHENINNSNIKDINSLFKYLLKKYPGLSKFIIRKNIIRVAVNHKYKTGNVRLKKNDVVALFPPVSGG